MMSWIEDIKLLAGDDERPVTKEWLERAEQEAPYSVLPSLIYLKRNGVKQLPCDEKLFRTIVKMSFNQRRKMLRNSLAQFFTGAENEARYLTLRPEQLSVKDFVELTQILSANGGQQS